MEQTRFSSATWSVRKKTTRRQAFLAGMESVIAWQRLIRLIEPIYPEVGAGRQSQAVERMLRIHFMQIWFNLSDPQAEDCLHDSESMRCFAGIEPESDAIPDEAAILRFRHLLEEHHLSEQIFAEVRAALEQRNVLLRPGRIVDAELEFSSGQAYSGQAHREAAFEHEVRTCIGGLIIRRATPADTSTIRRFLVELAQHHECLGKATITEDVIRSDFFSPSPRVHAAVAADEQGLCGLITWYYSYSTYRGRDGIHAEDCYVSARRRSVGLGKILMSYLADICVLQGCESVDWIALRANARTIEMCESIGAKRLEGFDPWRWDGESLLQAHFSVRAAQSSVQGGEIPPALKSSHPSIG